MADIFDTVNDKGGDDHWRNPPSDNGAMFSKSRDVGEVDIPKGKLDPMSEKDRKPDYG